MPGMLHPACSDSSLGCSSKITNYQKRDFAVAKPTGGLTLFIQAWSGTSTCADRAQGSIPHEAKQGFKSTAAKAPQAIRSNTLGYSLTLPNQASRCGTSRLGERKATQGHIPWKVYHRNCTKKALFASRSLMMTDIWMSC